MSHRHCPFGSRKGKAWPALAVPLLAGCDSAFSTLAPAGPAAEQIAALWWAMLIGSGLITVLVLALAGLAVWRGPRPSDERRWTIWWGLGFSMSVLAVLLAFALWAGERMIARDDGALQVQAEAQQWGWRFVQPGPSGPVETEGVLYVPAGQPFDIVLTSRDVIHSFWVPQLGGKMDAIPGHRNVHRLMADAPGTHEGLCAEFCGIGHAAMRFEVVVYDPAAPPPFVSAESLP
ncbi:cytochrome c oxidase subunit II [Paracoccus sp. WLY502]|uniref:cytochrome c oxidase subunit II n=1 Tax=Paracoccus yibinensis TaxID=3068891 RepID=UPI00279642AD|nr:cytochrome c oxidase subunit II [Paracoccus sp. WLY502]MDQ1899525.1 cytochrome c oxidase subunit II [Paracoccus sp. WLY502]